jgi:protein-disulfide isomerase
MKRSAVLGVAVLAAAPLFAGEGPADSKPVATFGNESVTMAELEKLGSARLFSIRTQEYGLKRQLVMETVDKRLLEKEAAARALTVADLLKAEVDGKAAKSTPAEQKEFYDKNKARFGATAEAEAIKQIENGLNQQKLRERRMEYAKELRTKAGLRVMLEPPRLAVEVAADEPSRGPAQAAVTVVEFSDFQCPYCSRVTPTLKKVQETYGDTVRVVYRDLPLVQIHPQAAKAAEAATCAHDQGKFWEMHDRLFADQSKLQVDELKKHAAELGLDTAAFNQCLDSSKHAAEWQQDAADASTFGVTSTPAFFINGRLLVGAQPFEAFAQVIDEELDLAGVAKPAAKPEAAASSETQ